MGGIGKEYLTLGVPPCGGERLIVVRWKKGRPSGTVRKYVCEEPDLSAGWGQVVFCAARLSSLGMVELSLLPPMGKQGRKVIFEEREMQRHEDEIEDGLPNPHGGEQKVEEHAIDQADFDIQPLAEDEPLYDEFVQSDQHRQEDSVRGDDLCKQGFVERHERISHPFL